MNGADGRPFKTRDGGTVKLIDLLDEAEQRAMRVGQEPRTRGGRAASDRPCGGHQRGQVRRPIQASHQRLPLQLRTDAELRRQHCTLPALCLHPRGQCVPKLGKGIDEISGQIQLDAEQELALAAKLAQFGEVLNSVGEKASRICYALTSTTWPGCSPVSMSTVRFSVPNRMRKAEPPAPGCLDRPYPQAGPGTPRPGTTGAHVSGSKEESRTQAGRQPLPGAGQAARAWLDLAGLRPGHRRIHHVPDEPRTGR